MECSHALCGDPATHAVDLPGYRSLLFLCERCALRAVTIDRVYGRTVTIVPLPAAPAPAPTKG